MIARQFTFSDVLFGTAAKSSGSQSGYIVEDRANGYLIDPLKPVPARWLAMQLCAMIAGAMLAAFGVGLILIAPAESFVWWLGASVGALALAALLMRVATRSLTPLIEVDLTRSEVKELAVSRTGTVSVVARYPFGSLGAVYLDRRSGRVANLCIRFKDRSGRVEIASGDIFDLEALRNRLGRDLHADAS